MTDLPTPSYGGDGPRIVGVPGMSESELRAALDAIYGPAPDRLIAPMNGPMDPVHPCRILSTRHCPAVYDAVCGDRPCARYESSDEAPWLPEVTGA